MKEEIVPRTRSLVLEENIQLSKVEAAVYDHNHFEIFHPWEQKRLTALLGKLSEGRKVLDVATGTGNIITKCDKAIERVGIDLSPDMMDKAHRKNNQIHFLEAVADHLPFPDNTFDLVVTYSSLHHFPDSIAVVREMARVLQPSGILILDHEEYFQEKQWKETVYQFLRTGLNVLANLYYWKQPKAAPWLIYREVHWPWSLTFQTINFELTDGNPVDLREIEEMLRSQDFIVARKHYLLCPLPMISCWQAGINWICRSFGIGHFFVVAKKQ